MMTGKKGFKRSEAADGNSACGLGCMGKKIDAVNSTMCCVVLCCVVFRDCIGRILFVKRFFEKMLTFLAPEYIFSPTDNFLWFGFAHQPDKPLNLTLGNYNAFWRFV